MSISIKDSFFKYLKFNDDLVDDDASAQHAIHRIRANLVLAIKQSLSRKTFNSEVQPWFQVLPRDSVEHYELTSLLDEAVSSKSVEDGVKSIVHFIPVAHFEPYSSSMLNVVCHNLGELKSTLAEYLGAHPDNLLLPAHLHSIDCVMSKITYQDLYDRNFSKLNKESATYSSSENSVGTRFLIVEELKSGLDSLEILNRIDFSDQTPNFFSQLDGHYDGINEDFYKKMGDLFSVPNAAIGDAQPFMDAIDAGVILQEDLRMIQSVSAILESSKLLPAEITCRLSYHLGEDRETVSSVRFNFCETASDLLVGGHFVQLNQYTSLDCIDAVIEDSLDNTFNIHTVEISSKFLAEDSPLDPTLFIDPSSNTWMEVEDSPYWEQIPAITH